METSIEEVCYGETTATGRLCSWKLDYQLQQSSFLFIRRR